MSSRLLIFVDICLWIYSFVSRIQFHSLFPLSHRDVSWRLKLFMQVATPSKKVYAFNVNERFTKDTLNCQLTFLLWHGKLSANSVDSNSLCDTFLQTHYYLKSDYHQSVHEFISLHWSYVVYKLLLFTIHQALITQKKFLFQHVFCFFFLS